MAENFESGEGGASKEMPTSMSQPVKNPSIWSASSGNDWQSATSSLRIEWISEALSGMGS